MSALAVAATEEGEAMVGGGLRAATVGNGRWWLTNRAGLLSIVIFLLRLPTLLTGK
jgi:hypothetical protein